MGRAKNGERPEICNTMEEGETDTKERIENTIESIHSLKINSGSEKVNCHHIQKNMF